MNLEHIFDGEQGIQGQGNNDIFFEPRRSPMTFTKISNLEAELHPEPTPTFHVESWTRFKMAPLHSVDFLFRFKPHQHAFRYIARGKILDAVDTFEIVEAHPEDKYLPSYLILAGSKDSAFHVLFATDLEG